MHSHEFHITPKAEETFRSIVMHMQEVSLIAAERVRSRIIHRLHLIHHQPLQSSRKIEVNGVQGHFRTADVLNYKLVYLLEEKRIVLMDILLDKEMSKV